MTCSMLCVTPLELLIDLRMGGRANLQQGIQPLSRDSQVLQGRG